MQIRSLYLHYIKFNIVGGIGIIVQLFALNLFTSYLNLNYLIATLMAVEVAILHNFFLHERWTWNDRRCGSIPDSIFRLLRFNSTTGIISIIGNLFFMKLLVGQGHIPIYIANLMAIAACSIFNFLVSNNFVFRDGNRCPDRGSGY
jgi:putative flippase GtrA